MTLSSAKVHGYRQPLFGMLKGTTKIFTRVYVNDVSDGQSLRNFNIHLNTTNHLAIQQTIEDSGEYTLRLFFNGQNIGETVNNEPLAFKNLGIFLGKTCFCEDDGRYEPVGRLWDFDYENLS